MRYVSLFSGIEAASVAWHSLGWEPLIFSEIETFPNAVLAARYPNVQNLGDITKIDWRNHYDCLAADLVVGGSPCQSFSVAGQREGLHGKSGLMWEYVRAIQAIRPYWLIWENVPGALSSAGGGDYQSMLQALDELGYCLAWRVLDAQYFGVAQRRRRVYLVGSLGNTGAAEVLFEPESLRWDHPTSQTKRQALTRAIGSGAQGADTTPNCLTLAKNQLNEQQTVLCATDSGTNSAIAEGIAPTLTAHDAKSASYVFSANNAASAGLSISLDTSPTLSTTKQPAVSVGGIVRRLMPVECERLQGFPDSWTDVPYNGKEHSPDSLRYKALGNSMPVPVMRWIGQRIQQMEIRDKIGKSK